LDAGRLASTTLNALISPNGLFIKTRRAWVDAIGFSCEKFSGNQYANRMSIAFVVERRAEASSSAFFFIRVGRQRTKDSPPKSSSQAS
ncbi:MAG TPA: hypothetical protein VIL95_07245, partial [Bacillota bacterium]